MTAAANRSELFGEILSGTIHKFLFQFPAFMNEFAFADHSDNLSQGTRVLKGVSLHRDDVSTHPLPEASGFIFDTADPGAANGCCLKGLPVCRSKRNETGDVVSKVTVHSISTYPEWNSCFNS
jgi:hypothetical protein